MSHYDPHYAIPNDKSNSSYSKNQDPTYQGFNPRDEDEITTNVPSFVIPENDEYDPTKPSLTDTQDIYDPSQPAGFVRSPQVNNPYNSRPQQILFENAPVPQSSVPHYHSNISPMASNSYQHLFQRGFQQASTAQTESGTEVSSFNTTEKEPVSSYSTSYPHQYNNQPGPNQPNLFSKGGNTLSTNPGFIEEYDPNYSTAGEPFQGQTDIRHNMHVNGNIFDKFASSDYRYVRGRPEAMYRERVNGQEESREDESEEVEHLTTVKQELSEDTLVPDGEHASDYLTEELGTKIKQENEQPSMSLDSIIDGFKGSKKSELTIENLIISSDYFLKKAHEQVLRTNNSNGRDIYFKLIKLSIQALLMIVKNYANVLTPYVEVIVFFKLASIYISETENIEKADEYVNRAIAISKRNKFAEALFLSEFLEAQIIEKSSPHLLINYLNEKITNYEESHFQNFANAFSLVKIDTLLTRDPDTSVILLQNLIQGSLDPLTHSYCLLHLSNLHLYRGSPAVAMELIEEADRLIDISGNVPVQLKAMSSLTRYYAYIESNEVDLSTKLMKSISSLMSSEQKVSWKTWREDGIFKLDLPMNDGNNMSYKVFWLNSDEFVIMFYFLTGVHFMCEAANGKKKSKKVFDKCLQIIEKQLAELENFSEEDRELNIVALSDRLVKLKFTKYCIKCYQAWIGFLNNDWKAINYLNEFMSSYNNRKFTNREFVYFSLLLPKVFYLFALYYHEKGDLQAAKYYYLKVRNLTSGTNSINSKVPPCSNIGIGSAIIAPKQEFSELFAFSTLHLFILSLFELKEAAKVPAERRNEILSGCHKLSNQLYKDLNEAFITKSTSNSFSQGFASSNDLLRMTYKVHAELSKDISSGDNSPNVIAEISECYEKYENSTFFPFIGNLVKYLLFTMTTDIAQKNAYFEKCLSVVSTPNGSDFDKIVSVFILKSLIHHFRRSGENERANMAELQLQYFQKCLSEKFKFVSENVHL